MSRLRHPTTVIAIVCSSAVLGLLVWRLIDAPEKPALGSAGQSSVKPEKPSLDTDFRPPPKPATENPDKALRPVLREMLNDATPLARRMEILTNIESDLSADEAMALLRELSVIPKQEENSAAHSSYIHELCNQLQKAIVVRDDFANALATVASDRKLPLVYRDYAFQHLRMLWRASRDEAGGKGQTRMRAIENTFYSLLQAKPETAAQSLLGLHEICDASGSPVLPDAEISRIATTILTSPPAKDSIPARMTAVRVLAERKIPENSPLLRGIAASSAEHTLVRISAVAALGFMGETSDLEFLATLTPDDPVIAAAVRDATKRD